MSRKEIQHNWYAACAKCGRVREKKTMNRLYYSVERYGTPKVLCFLCESCFCTLLDEWEISM